MVVAQNLLNIREHREVKQQSLSNLSLVNSSIEQMGDTQTFPSTFKVNYAHAAT